MDLAMRRSKDDPTMWIVWNKRTGEQVSVVPKAEALRLLGRDQPKAQPTEV